MNKENTKKKKKPQALQKKNFNLRTLTKKKHFFPGNRQRVKAYH